MLQIQILEVNLLFSLLSFGCRAVSFSAHVHCFAIWLMRLHLLVQFLKVSVPEL